MQELTLQIPESLIRKIKAYSILTGAVSGIDEMVVEFMEEMISLKIVEAASVGVDLLEESEFPTPSGYDRRKQAVSRIHRSGSVEPLEKMNSSEFASDEISMGLGDDDITEDEEPEDPSDKIVGTADENAFVPRSGGISENDLDDDMKVANPQMEANADVATFADELREGGEEDKSPEDLFSEVADLPPPPPTEENIVEAHRQARIRKSRTGRKAKATMHVESTDAPPGVTLV